MDRYRHFSPTQKTERMSNTDFTKHRWYTHVLAKSWYRIYISTKKIVVYFAEGLSLTFLQITVKYTDDKFLTQPFWIVFSDAKCFTWQCIKNIFPSLILELSLNLEKKIYNMFITSIIQSAAILQYALLTWMKGIHNYLLVPDW